MKANELRIGNFLTDRVNILQVYGLQNENIYCNIYKYEGNGDKIIEPILLTEEWLLKFGFYKSDNYGNDEYRLDGYSYFRGSFYISDCDECGESVEINFVHELQNLYFALTGEELTMK